MHKTLRRLPSLDFLRGFEAAGRLSSFTRAADELSLTQSALSRQVRALEDALGVALFERRHRALALTREGAALHRDVVDALGAIASAAERARSRTREPGLTVTTTVSFASLGLIPRLSSFRERHPDVDVLVSADDRIVDLAREAGRPLLQPEDLARHVLLHYDDPEGRAPWLDWRTWLAANGVPALKPAGSLRFRLYDQVIQAAVSGQGVALGRLPLIAGLLADGRLAAPFPRRYESAREFRVLVAPHARDRADVDAFVRWVAGEARATADASESDAGAGVRKPARPASRGDTRSAKSRGASRDAATRKAIKAARR